MTSPFLILPTLDWSVVSLTRGNSRHWAQHQTSVNLWANLRFHLRSEGLKSESGSFRSLDCWKTLNELFLLFQKSIWGKKSLERQTCKVLFLLHYNIIKMALSPHNDMFIFHGSSYINVTDHLRVHSLITVSAIRCWRSMRTWTSRFPRTMRTISVRKRRPLCERCAT